MNKIAEFLMPLGKKESPEWFYRAGRLIVALCVLFLPLVYDEAVPEVGADPRWYMMHWATLLLAALFLLSRIETGGKLHFSLPLSAWAVLAATICALLSLIDSYNIIRSYWWIKHFLSYSAFFAFIFMLRHDQWYRNLMWLVAIPVGLNSILGITQFFDIKDAMVAEYLPLWASFGEVLDKFRQAAPPAATFANKNLVASYLVLVLPVVFYLFAQTRHRGAQVFAAVLLALGTTFLVYTRSRGSWVAAAAMLVFFVGWLAFNKEHRHILRASFDVVKGALLVVVAGVVLWASQYNSPVRGYHSIDKTVTEQAASIAKMDMRDIGVRVAYNLNTLGMVRDHPFNGVGLGAFHQVYPRYHDVYMKTPEIGYAVEARPQRTHNDLLQAFAEMGIPGGMAFLVMFFSVFMMSWKLARNSKIPVETQLLVLFISTGIFGVGINALGDFPLQMPTVPYFLWAFLGVISGIFVLYIKKADFGFKRSFIIPKPAFSAMALGCALLLAFIVQDDLKRREGSIYLKTVMSYAAAEIYNDMVLNEVDKSYETYPLNARMLEYRATAYSNHSGSRTIPLEKKIAVIEESLQYDPYAPNNLINLGGVYYRKADRLIKSGRLDEVEKVLADIEDVYIKLVLLAHFAPHTYTIGGFGELLHNQPNKSLALFNKALEKDAQYSPAVTGRTLSLQALKIQGVSDDDIRILDGKKPVRMKSLGIPSAMKILGQKEVGNADPVSPAVHP